MVQCRICQQEEGWLPLLKSEFVPQCRYELQVGEKLSEIFESPCSPEYGRQGEQFGLSRRSKLEWQELLHPSHEMGFQNTEPIVLSGKCWMHLWIEAMHWNQDPRGGGETAAVQVLAWASFQKCCIAEICPHNANCVPHI